MNPRLTEMHFVRTSDADGLTRAKAAETLGKLRAQRGRREQRPHAASWSAETIYETVRSRTVIVKN